MISCSYHALCKTVKAGSVIYIADGNLTCIVKEIHEKHVTTECQSDYELGEKKNMNLPGAVVDLPTLTEKDIDDIKNFGVKHQVDYIAASFVRKASDIAEIKKILGKEGSHIKIIPKIEN